MTTRFNPTTTSPATLQGTWRWFVLAALIVAAVGTLVLAEADRQTSPSGVTETAVVAPAAFTDFTRSQRLIDQAITDALHQHDTTDFTRSQRLIDQAITDALLSRASG